MENENIDRKVAWLLVGVVLLTAANALLRRQKGFRYYMENANDGTIPLLLRLAYLFLGWLAGWLATLCVDCDWTTLNAKYPLLRRQP